MRIPKKPRIYIRDQKDVVVDVLRPKDYYDTNLGSYMKGNASRFKFTMIKKPTTFTDLTVVNNLAFRYDNVDYWLACMIVDQTETTMTVEAWPLGLEWANEEIGPYKAGTAMTFEQYFNLLSYQKSIVLNINEVDEKKITYEWDGTQTKLERLYSLATVFNAEIEFKTELNADGSLLRQVLNVYKEHDDNNQGMGLDRRNEIFKYGKDIKSISYNVDKTGVKTAITGTGKDGLTIASIEAEVKDADGNILYATYKTAKPGMEDPKKIYAVQAVEQFPSQTNITDKWTVAIAGQSEHATAQALYGYLLSELKKMSTPEVTWDVQGWVDGNVGDTIRIRDDGYQPPLLLEARISEQHRDLDDPSQNTTTFTNVEILKSKLSQNIMDQVAALIAANKQYQASIETEGGFAFKNNQGQSIFHAVIRDGALDVTDQFKVQWYKDTVYIGNAKDITVLGTDIVDKSLYYYEYYDSNNTLRGRVELTVTNTNDGTQGAPGKDGTDGKDGSPGADGQTFYPHHGYLMADGTLVNQVPNENLLNARLVYPSSNNSTAYPITNTTMVEDGKQFNRTKRDNPTSQPGIFSIFTTIDIRAFAAKLVGKRVGLSMMVRASSPVNMMLMARYLVGTTNNIFPGEADERVDVRTYWTQVKFVVESFPASVDSIRFNPLSIINPVPDLTNFYLDTRDWKVEILEPGQEPSYYTTPPNVDYENAYPKYEGFYSDTNQAHSTDPDKYKPWVPFIGPKGDKGDKGDNAPTISLSGATQVITVSKTGVITPSSSFTVVGTPVNTTITTWLYSVDGGAFVTTLPTGVTRSTNTVTINPATSTFKSLSIRAADATVMDIFTIARIIEAKDGTDGTDGTNGTNGSNGADGKDAYTVILSNEAYTFPGSTTGALAGSTTTTISIYKGITKVNPTAITVGTKPTGMTSTVSGLVSAVVTFTVTTAMVTKGGTVPIDIVVDGITFTKLFSYAISLQGVKGADGTNGRDGDQGPPGVDGKEVFSGYLSNDSIIVPANNAGTVTDFSKANGTFTTFLGQVQLTSGVVYSLVSNSGLTSTINSSTGAYSVTAISGDTGTATYKAVYNGITIQKILIVTKSKQGPNGATGPAGAPTGIIAQSTAPTSPYVGMLWKNTTAGNGATYRWTGSAWEAYVFTAVNISAENLAAITGRIGELYNDYTRTYNDNTTAVGTLAIKDAEITNNGVIKNSSGTTIQSYNSVYSHQLISLSRYEGSVAGDQTKLLASAGLTFDTLSLMSKDTGFSGVLTAEMLYDTGWVNLTLLRGTGQIRVRKFMKRYLIQFADYKWDAAGPSQPNDAIAQLPPANNPGRNQLFNVKVWSVDPQRNDAFQLNSDGRLYKLSNNSTTLYFRETKEVFD